MWAMKAPSIYITFELNINKLNLVCKLQVTKLTMLIKYHLTES